MPRSRGLFITFEGGEGAGKSTQIQRLAATLNEKGLAVLTTREPGGSPAAERIRSVILDDSLALDAMTALLLFNAARRDHWQKTILPALISGQTVLCDRFYDSTYAYQGAAAGMTMDVMEALTEHAIGHAKPDLTVIFDLPAEIGLKRASARRGNTAADSFEARPSAFHEALRKGFLEIAAREPARCHVVDATGSENDVALRVLAAIEPALRQFKAAG